MAIKHLITGAGVGFAPVSFIVTDGLGAYGDVAVTTQSGVSRLARAETQPTENELSRRRGYVLNQRRIVQNLNAEFDQRQQELKDKAKEAGAKRAASKITAAIQSAEPQRIVAVANVLAEDIRRRAAGDEKLALIEASVVSMLEQAQSLAELMKQRQLAVAAALEAQRVYDMLLADDEAAIMAILTVM